MAPPRDITARRSNQRTRSGKPPASPHTSQLNHTVGNLSSVTSRDGGDVSTDSDEHLRAVAALPINASRKEGLVALLEGYPVAICYDDVGSILAKTGMDQSPEACEDFWTRLVEGHSEAHVSRERVVDVLFKLGACAPRDTPPTAPSSRSLTPRRQPAGDSDTRRPSTQRTRQRSVPRAPVRQKHGMHFALDRVPLEPKQLTHPDKSVLSAVSASEKAKKLFEDARRIQQRRVEQQKAARAAEDEKAKQEAKNCTFKPVMSRMSQVLTSARLDRSRDVTTSWIAKDRTASAGRIALPSPRRSRTPQPKSEGLDLNCTFKPKITRYTSPPPPRRMPNGYYNAVGRLRQYSPASRRDSFDQSLRRSGSEPRVIRPNTFGEPREPRHRSPGRFASPDAVHERSTRVLSKILKERIDVERMHSPRRVQVKTFNDESKMIFSPIKGSRTRLAQTLVDDGVVPAHRAEAVKTALHDVTDAALLRRFNFERVRDLLPNSYAENYSRKLRDVSACEPINDSFRLPTRSERFRTRREDGTTL